MLRSQFSLFLPDSLLSEILSSSFLPLVFLFYNAFNFFSINGVKILCCNIIILRHIIFPFKVIISLFIFLDPFLSKLILVDLIDKEVAPENVQVVTYCLLESFTVSLLFRYYYQAQTCSLYDPHNHIVSSSQYCFNQVVLHF